MASQDVSVAWGRRRLLAVLAGLVAFVLLVIGGLTYTVVDTLAASDAPAASQRIARDWPVAADGTRGSGYRDALAAKPMLAADADDMKPAAPATQPAELMVIDPPKTFGPADVASGFENTPQGAVGQLAAIEIAVLGPMSIQTARSVHSAWAMSGAPFDDWGLTESIQAFHQAAGTIDGDSAVSVTATPVGAQIKGADGPRWVLACVQLDVTVAVVEQTRFGFGHCERMQWAGDRWMIAPGTPPAQAPSTWPGSQRSRDAGWLRWAETDTVE